MPRRNAVAAFAGPQRRFWTARDLLARGGLPPQLRAEGDDDDTAVREFPDPAWATEGIPTRGHSLVFDKRELIGDPEWGFYESFAPGSTKKTISEADIRLLQNHDPNFFLARTKAQSDGMGTYQAHAEDKTGLYHEARLLPTSYAYDLALGLRTGVVSQMSVAFWPMKWELGRVKADGTDPDGDDERQATMLHVRHLEIALTDESYVTFPAYVDTDASLRVAGMGMLLEAAGQRTDPTRRASLIEAVLTGTVRDDAAPILRAALTALVDLAAAEPGEPTRNHNPADRYARSRLLLEVAQRRRQLDA